MTDFLTKEVFLSQSLSRNWRLINDLASRTISKYTDLLIFHSFSPVLMCSCLSPLGGAQTVSFSEMNLCLMNEPPATTLLEIFYGENTV